MNMTPLYQGSPGTLSTSDMSVFQENGSSNGIKSVPVSTVTLMDQTATQQITLLL